MGGKEEEQEEESDAIILKQGNTKSTKANKAIHNCNCTLTIFPFLGHKHAVFTKEERGYGDILSTGAYDVYFNFFYLAKEERHAFMLTHSAPSRALPYKVVRENIFECY